MCDRTIAHAQAHQDTTSPISPRILARNETQQLAGDCESCQTLATTAQKETLTPIESILPGEKVGTDLFSWSGKYYLLTIDYVSSWWEVDRLKYPTTTAVFLVLKEHFGRWGIPSTLISDNEPRFTAAQFQRFCLNGRFSVTIALLDI